MLSMQSHLVSFLPAGLVNHPHIAKTAAMVRTGAQSYRNHASGREGSLSSSNAGLNKWTNAVDMMMPLPRYSVGCD